MPAAAKTNGSPFFPSERRRRLGASVPFGPASRVVGEKSRLHSFDLPSQVLQVDHGLLAHPDESGAWPVEIDD
jgi:hypothetical protein